MLVILSISLAKILYDQLIGDVELYEIEYEVGSYRDHRNNAACRYLQDPHTNITHTSPRFTHTNATPAGHDAPRFRVHPTIQNHNKKKHGQDVISKNRHPFREIPNYETDSLVGGS